MTSLPRERALAGALFAVGTLSYYSSADMVLAGDGRGRYDALVSFLSHTPQIGATYAMAMPLCATPLYLAGRVLGNPLQAVSFFSLLFTLCCLPLLWRALRGVSEAATATLTVMLLAGASPLLAYTPFFVTEPFNALLLSLAILWREQGFARPAGAVLLLGTISTPASLLASLLLCTRWSLQEARWRWLFVAGLAFLEYLVECWYFGHSLSGLSISSSSHTTIIPFSGSSSFGYPPLFGLLNLTLSFGKGLLFFCPGLWLWWSVRGRLRTRERAVLLDMLLYLLGLLVVYCYRTDWQGDDLWGPRFLIFGCLPASLLLAVALRERPGGTGALLLTLAALLASGWVGINGLTYNLAGLPRLFWGDRQQFYFATYSTPELSPLFMPFGRGFFPIPSRSLALTFWTFLAADLCLAWPLLRTLADRIGRWEIPEGRWRF